MTTVFLTVLSYVLCFSLGVLCTLGVLTWLDSRVRTRHELHAESDVTRALREYDTAQDGAR